MNYASIRNNDIANGEGVRVSLFVSGCTFHCPGCFNPEAQGFNFGQHYTTDTMLEIFGLLKQPTISGLSLLGGDPLCQRPHGISKLMELCSLTHSMHKTVWLWTGYRWEDIFSSENPDHLTLYRKELLSNCDVVIDGPFKEELADRKLVWRGSANQRVIDVQASLRAGLVVTYQNSGGSICNVS